MNVLITSGGTTERIDTVRSISNMSTGKLGSLIADRFLAEPQIEKIIYVCGDTAIKPQSPKVEIIHIDNVSSLETAIRESLHRVNIDIIIHAMAVSDYRVSTVTSMGNITDSIISNLEKIKKSDIQSARAMVASLLKNPESAISGNGKIKSDLEDMLLFMERTPKIISLFQLLAPQSTLVGFKLLDNVPVDVLIDKGFRILTENKCAYVLANDLRNITGEQHTGYLIDKEKSYTRYTSKTEIASAIVSAAIRERTKAL